MRSGGSQIWLGRGCKLETDSQPQGQCSAFPLPVFPRKPGYYSPSLSTRPSITLALAGCSLWTICPPRLTNEMICRSARRQENIQPSLVGQSLFLSTSPVSRPWWGLFMCERLWKGPSLFPSWSVLYVRPGAWLCLCPVTTGLLQGRGQPDPLTAASPPVPIRLGVWARAEMNGGQKSYPKMVGLRRGLVCDHPCMGTRVAGPAEPLSSPSSEGGPAGAASQCPTPLCQRGSA